VLLYLTNAYCKPYLLYGAEVVDWRSSELSRMNCAFNSDLCRVSKVNFNSLDVIHTYNDLYDVKSEIEIRKCKFLNKSKTINNVVVHNTLLIN